LSIWVCKVSFVAWFRNQTFEEADIGRLCEHMSGMSISSYTELAPSEKKKGEGERRRLLADGAIGAFLEVEAQRELGDSRAIDVRSGLPELA